jgi:hypothetical protein
MNFKQFIKRLPEACLNRFLRNVFKHNEDEGLGDNLEYFNTSKDYIDWVNEAFTWADTPEGERYWSKIAVLHSDENYKDSIESIFIEIPLE